MELVRISPAQAKEILKDRELWERISEDGLSYKEYKVPDYNVYLGIQVDDKLIGLWWLEFECSSSINIHINILKEHRKHAFDAGNLFLSHFKDNFSEQFQKLNCKIPVIYKDVYNFTKKFGFQDEGLDRLSIVKNGELIDRYILGITRGEINGRSNCKYRPDN